MRGMTLFNQVEEEFDAAYSVGKTLDLNVSSFTSDKNVTGAFMNGSYGSAKDVLLDVDGKMNALPVENLSHYPHEREWFAGGRFIITSVEKKGPFDGPTVIHIKQIESLKGQR
jgi:hypothetical protein